MNALEKMDKFLLTPPNRGLATTLKILAGIVRWTWRIISIGATLFVGVFLLAGLHPGAHFLPTDPEDIAAVIIGVFFFAAMVLAWWREGLGGLIMLLIVPFAAVLMVVMNWHAQKSGAEMFAAAEDCLGLTVPAGTILFSWSLHTLNDHAVSARKRRLAVLVALVFVVPVAILLWQVFSHPFSLIPANG